MRGIARVTDRTSGTCSHPSHLTPIQTGGRIVTGSGNMFDENLPVARLNDMVETDCGHRDFIKSASGTIYNDAGLVQRVARLDDTVGRDGIYDAKIISASTKLYGDP